MAEQYPLWTQDQAIAYEAARDAINDVLAGYSAQIGEASRSGTPADLARIAWLEMRTDQAIEIMRSLSVTDTRNVNQVRQEFSAIFRAHKAAMSARAG